jgi:hypothetical protein
MGYYTIGSNDIVTGADFRIPGSVTTRMVIDGIVGNRVNLSLRNTASNSVLAFYQLPLSDVVFCLSYLSYERYYDDDSGGLYGEEDPLYGGGNSGGYVPPDYVPPTYP